MVVAAVPTFLVDGTLDGTPVMLLDLRPLLAPRSRLPARGIAAFILSVVVLNALAWPGVVIPDRGEHPPGFLDAAGLTADPIWVQDLAVRLPALTIVAVQLWHSRPAGVLLSGATLAGVVLFVGLAAATLVPLVLWLRAAPARTRTGGQS